MFCKNCGNQVNDIDKYCYNCGAIIEKSTNRQNQELNVEPNICQPEIKSVYQNNGSPNKKSNIIFIIGAIIIILLVIIIIRFGNNNSDSNYANNNDNNVEVKGNYSREVFSGNSFDYVTYYDKAVFTFNSNSTFEVNYAGGNTYKGTYEVYNGLYIAIRTDDIKNDPTINNGELLANDINNVTNAMMDSTNDMLNTYLLWLEVDGGIIQPFVISYNPDTNSGTAVNILGQTQGSFSLK